MKRCFCDVCEHEITGEIFNYDKSSTVGKFLDKEFGFWPEDEDMDEMDLCFLCKEKIWKLIKDLFKSYLKQITETLSQSTGLRFTWGYGDDFCSQLRPLKKDSNALEADPLQKGLEK